MTEQPTPTAVREKSGGGEAGPRTRLSWKSLLQDYSIIWICLVLFVYLSFASDVFLSERNIVNLLDQWGPIGIVACAGTLVLISRMFDLSVGSVFALAGVVSAVVTVNTGSPWLGFLTALVAAGVVGLINGIAVAIFNINPFIVTLATSLIILGVAIFVSGGLLIPVTEPGFTALGQNSFLRLTLPGLLFIVVAAVSWFVLARTTFGRRVYAVGGNPEAARFSGIRVGSVHIIVFVLSGLAAGLAGILSASRVGSGQADVGTNLPLLVISCVVVGGTSIFGGEGSLWRTLLGVLLFAMIGNGFTLLNVNSDIQQGVQGLILLVAVGIDAWSKKRK